MTTTIISSGSNLSDLVVSGGDLLEILDGGEARSTTVSSGGKVILANGAVADRMTVANGGLVSGPGVLEGPIYVDGTVEGATYSDEAYGLVVSSGGLTSGVTIASRSVEFIDLGGRTSGGVITSGGALLISGARQAPSVTVGVLSSGVLKLGVATVALDENAVLGGGSVLANVKVSSGGDVELEANSMQVSGGTLTILGGDSISSTTVFVGGIMSVASSAEAHGTTVSSGGKVILTSGAEASGVAVARGGLVSGPGVVAGSVYVEGTLDGATYSDDVYSLAVSSGGLTSGVTIASRSLEVLDLGGRTSGGVIASEGTLFVSGARLTPALTVGVLLSGVLKLGVATTALDENAVLSGGSVLADVKVSSGGDVELETNSVQVSGGTLTILDGDSISNTTVFVGGIMSVASGAEAHGTTVSSGGKANLAKGAEASGLTLASGGLVSGPGVVAGSVYVDGTLEGATYSDGVYSLAVSSGGLTSGVTIASRSLEVIDLGGRTSGGVIASGGTLFVDGARLSPSSTVGVLSGGVLKLGVATAALDENAVLGGGSVLANVKVSSGGDVELEANSMQVSGGTLTILEGDSIANTTVFVGGVMSVASGAEAHGTTVSSGGKVSLAKGAEASGVVVASGGLMSGPGLLEGSVYVDGTLEGATYSDEAYGLVVSSGGLTSGVTIASRSLEDVDLGGRASGTTVLSGASLQILSGGKLAGALVLSGGTTTLASGAVTTGAALAFVGSGGVLAMASGASFAGTISGFNNRSQEIDLQGFAFSSGETVSWVEASGNTSGTLTIKDGGQSLSLKLLGKYTTGNFTLSEDSRGGTVITDPPVTSPQTRAFAQAMAGFAAPASAAEAAIGSASSPMSALLAHATASAGHF